MQHRQNDILVINDTALIALRRLDGSLKATAAIDKDDWEKVRHISWSLSGNGYASGYFKNNKYVLLHHLILGQPPTGLETDHENRNKLDCRSKNLHFVTHSQNTINRDLRPDNKSGCVGVHKRGDRFRAWIDRDGIREYLGTYSSAEEAASIRKKTLEERRCRTSQKRQNLTFLSTKSETIKRRINHGKKKKSRNSSRGNRGRNFL